MITPDEIRKKATRKYSEFLKAVLERKPFFPLSIKGSKGSANAPLETLFPALKLLLEDSKDKLGFGYEVSLKTVNTRHAGAISMPDDIYFDNLDDYLQFIDKKEEFIHFQKTILSSLRALPQLKSWILAHPLQAIKKLNQWEDIIKVCLFFQKNPTPNCYIRELPIDVSPTFIQENKTILSELLDILIPSEQKTESIIFEERFGLRYDAPTIRIRLLDENVIPSLPSFIEDINLPSNTFQQLNIAAETVFLVEDKTCFLAFPNHPKSIVLWTGNLEIKELLQLAHLKDKKIYFWGDVSPTTFEKLHQIRYFFPQIQSLLMDKQTFDNFEKHAVQQKQNPDIEHLSNLNIKERECYLFLKNSTGLKAVEQIQITQRHLLETLEAI